jgi:alpha-1,2-mannosyltransferase
VRLAGAALNPIADCDESFNYWEPLHFLLHGSGMQTWEYGGQYALRPYLYILLHRALAEPLGALTGARRQGGVGRGGVGRGGGRGGRAGRRGAR